MTDTSREAVERLLDGVTEGPWLSNYPPYHTGMVEIVGPSLRCVGFTIATDVDADKSIRIRADARFIAAARDLVPALLARAEAAETKLAIAVEVYENGFPAWDTFGAATRAIRTTPIKEKDDE